MRVILVQGQRLAEVPRVRVIVQRAPERARAGHLHLVVVVVAVVVDAEVLGRDARGGLGAGVRAGAADATDAAGAAAGVKAGRAGIVLAVPAGVTAAVLVEFPRMGFRSWVVRGVRPFVILAISARGLTLLPTDLQFVASSDMRISSESLSSPMTTVTGNSRWRQARGEVRGQGCHLLMKKWAPPPAGKTPEKYEGKFQVTRGSTSPGARGGCRPGGCRRSSPASQA